MDFGSGLLGLLGLDDDSIEGLGEDFVIKELFVFPVSFVLLDLDLSLLPGKLPLKRPVLPLLLQVVGS